MFGRGRGGVASAGGKDVKRSQFEKGSSQFASVNPWEPAELWERHAANQKLTVLGQGGVDGPWSLSDTDRTGKIGPGRGVSWKKLSRPGEGAVGPVRMGKLLQAREECPRLLHMLEKERPPCWSSLPGGRSSPQNWWRLDLLSLRGMAGPVPGASSGHPDPSLAWHHRKPCSWSRPVSATAGHGP